MKRSTRTASGFTLVELLVVILIIALLVSILIPVVSKVRTAAYATNSSAQIQGLSAAIQQYYQTYSAYPGPLNADQLGPSPAVPVNIKNLTGQTVTGTENLVLGLLGGLKYDLTPPAGIAFDWELVGRGPHSLSPTRPQKYEAYVESHDLSWTDSQPSGASNEPGPSSGYYADDVTPARAAPPGALDSVVPEFVDRFPNPMPVLYLRARRGAGGIVSIGSLNSAGTPMLPNPTPPPPGFPTQYDLKEILAYTDPDGQPDPAVPPTGASIGVGKNFDEYYQAGALKDKPAPYHGLRTVDATRSMTTQGPNYFLPADAFPYFENPSTPGTPRQKDGYILISAGKDRVYGTDDDITNFGPVIPAKSQ